MSRVTFLEPTGKVNPVNVSTALSLVGVEIPGATIVREGWCTLELLVAYDWAMREHLDASDNRIQRRPCPSFVKRLSRGGT